MPININDIDMITMTKEAKPEAADAKEVETEVDEDDSFAGRVLTFNFMPSAQWPRVPQVKYL